MAKTNDISLYELPTEGVLRALGTTAAEGLSDREVRRRRRRGKNRIYNEERTSFWRYAATSAFDLLLLLLLLTSVTASFFHEETAYRVIIPILILSVILRTVAYTAARRYLESRGTARVVMPTVSVRRGGEVSRVDARDIVKGDILILAEGDLVPADCRIVEAAELEVYEESATGVHGGVRKSTEAQPFVSGFRRDMIFAGSCVLSGTATAVVLLTGDETLAVRTKGKFKASRDGGVPRLSRLLEAYSRKWGATMMIVAFAVTVVDIFFGERGIYEAFFMGLSLAVASMCEYYAAIGDIASAMGLSALERSTGICVRGIGAVSAMSETDVVIIRADGMISTEGVDCQAYFYDGEVHDMTSRADKTADAEDDSANVENEPDVQESLESVPPELLKLAALTTPYTNGDEHEYSEAAISLGTFLSYIGYDAGDLYGEGESSVMLCGRGDGLSFDTRLLDLGDGYKSVCCGDAAEVVSRCSYVSARGNNAALTDSVREGVGNFIAYHERRGAVAVAVATKRTPFRSRERMSFTQTDMTLVGILILYCPLAPYAAEAVDACRRAGMRVVVAGDGVSSARIADRAGIITGKDDIITGSEFAALSDAEKCDAAARVRLIYGFDTRQTADFIRTHKACGAKVAYVASPGRGLKGELSLLGLSDAGFALDDAPEVLKSRADSIVPRGDVNGGGFPAIADAISHARRIYRNILNIASFFLTSQAARIFSVLYTVLYHKSALAPEQILLWGLIFDFFAVLVLARERPDADSLVDRPRVIERLSHPFSNLSVPAAFGLLWAALTMLVPAMFAKSDEQAAAMIFVSVLLTLVVVCGEHRSGYPVFSNKRAYNYAALVYAAAVALVIVLITVFPAAAELLSLASPDYVSLLFSVIPPVVLLGAYEIRRLVSGGETS